MKEQFQKLKEKTDRVHSAMIGKLRVALKACPDNPRATRVSENCQIISSADLVGECNVWSPSFHDFKLQYKIVVEEVDRLIQSAGLNAVINFIDRLLERGMLEHQVHGKVKFHPKVLKRISEIWNGKI